MSPSEFRWLQADLYVAHTEARQEDERRRRINQMTRQAWEAKGGPEAESTYFEWLRVQNREVAL